MTENLIYTSIQQEDYKKALKYINRAKIYQAEGKYAHCAGCLAKAARKLHKAKFWDDMCKFDDIMNVMLSEIANNLDNQILIGSSLKIKLPE